MKKQDVETGKREKRFLWAGIGVGILMAVYVTFSLSFNRVYDLLLEKDLQQAEFTSRYVTKLIETELENVVADLQISQSILLRDQDEAQAQMVEQLKELRIRLKFEKLTVCDLNGDGITWEGRIVHVDQPEMLLAASSGQNYIASVVNELDAILLAVPIIRNQEPVGVLCGHYQVEQISKNIELDANSPQYFQIVDDSGRYISDANNANAFAWDEDIWKELIQYELSGEITTEEIRRDMEAGRSGSFHFTYQGSGRYVAYEPLGINNWYVFSILTEDYVRGYVLEIEKLFSALLWGVLGCAVIFFAFIWREVYRTTALIREQNGKLASNNSLLFMVLKHTKDIPFETDLDKRTLTLYRTDGQDEAAVKKLEEYFPDSLLEKQVLGSEDYETYKRIFNNMINRRTMEPELVKLRIGGVWTWVKIHYKIIGDSQVIGFLENYNEQVYQYEQLQEINRKSRMDPLTALYNRAYFTNEVEQRISRQGPFKPDGYSALFLLDLDYFKQVNDTLGHIVGDEILKASAQAMRSAVRSTDLCGRLGGDEFVLFIENVRNLEAVQVCARKLNEALRRTYGAGKQAVNISASIGIALLTSETTFEELYHLADVALYRVKMSGRNGFYIISKDTEEEEKTYHETEDLQ